MTVPAPLPTFPTVSVNGSNANVAEVAHVFAVVSIFSELSSRSQVSEAAFPDQTLASCVKRPGRNVVGWPRYCGAGENAFCDPTGTVTATGFGL